MEAILLRYLLVVRWDHREVVQTYKHGQVYCKLGRRFACDDEGLQPLKHWLPR